MQGMWGESRLQADIERHKMGRVGKSCHLLLRRRWRVATGVGVALGGVAALRCRVERDDNPEPVSDDAVLFRRRFEDEVGGGSAADNERSSGCRAFRFVEVT